ncbi:MAG TPA: DUF58 domain-containing protein [Stenotrophobium sp.]|jgi:uncharacterized protein (DUF58 family)|nr:DUF58 domain-containing protein [Stenotrophobium sp.]
MRFWLVFKILLHPLRYAQERIDRWVLARVKRQPGPIEIGRRRVYIVPTRFGYGFAVMLLVMLLGAMNYSNSMAFALCFLLAGLGLVCMHHTHGNLVNLVLHAGRSVPVFTGEIAHFEIRVENPARQDRYAIALSWPKHDDDAVIADIAAQVPTPMQLTLPASKRGWLSCGIFSVATEFPLGLFHAWTWAELEMACLVYPRPAPPGLTPPATAGSGGHTEGGRHGQDEFSGLRNYQHGDTARSIHWKSLPKLPSPMVKQFYETTEQAMWLDWTTLHGLDTEARLSQLTRWVLDAEDAQHAYGLRLPGTVIAPGRGAPHQHRCLKALALFERP